MSVRSSTTTTRSIACCFGSLLRFIKDGFAYRDNAIHVVNPDQRHDHLQRLTAVGIDPTEYLRDGRLDQDRMFEVFEQLASGRAKGGLPLIRTVCHVDWAAES